jgi:anhydro-N-acetylmuramic acid kinase
MNVVGLMSGTSADGIDAAVVSLEGAPPRLDWRLLAHVTVAHPPELRDRIFAAFRPETGAVDRLCRLNFDLGAAFADAARAAMDAAQLKPEDVLLIGSHGQTVWHEPPTRGTSGATLQIGSAAVIAERTGITTISNFRARDVAAGGHGAPLTSFVDALLFRHPTRTRAIQNIGGIGNVTFLPPLGSSRDPIAFDTGPGNMLIDYCAARASAGAQSFDRDGKLAARGQAQPAWLAELMAHDYFRAPPPKTTGRELFGAQFGAQVWQRGQALHLSDADILATVTAFTAESIAQAYRDFAPIRLDEVYLAGGGVRNPTLVEMIRARIAPVKAYSHDELGVSASAKEAVTFAVLAYETYHGRAGNLPSCTGAAHRVVLGDLTPGKNQLSLLRAFGARNDKADEEECG